MKNNNRPRKPTQAELSELAQFNLLKLYGEDYLEEEKQEMELRVSEIYIAVFDHFISDSPGYVGKVMMAIWGAGPEMYEVYIWSNAQIQQVAPDLSLFDPFE